MGVGLGTYVWPVNVTTPSGTAIASPITTTPKLGDIWIDSVELRIPVGHRGLTGIYVANSGTQLLPYSQTPSFLIGDDERLTFDFGVEVATGLQIVTYNTDIFVHTHYLRISGRPMVTQNLAAAPVVQAVPIVA